MIQSVQPVFFDVFEYETDGEAWAYVIGAVGDDGYLYFADIPARGLDVADPTEKIHFNKIDILNFNLDLAHPVFSCMKITSRSTHYPNNVGTVYVIYVAVQTRFEGDLKNTLYMFERQYNAVVNSYKWVASSVDIPNTTICIAEDTSHILLGGPDGVVRVSKTDIKDVSVIKTDMPIKTITTAGFITFAGDEYGVLVSNNAFDSYTKLYPETTTGGNILPGGVGKIVAANLLPIEKNQAFAYLFQDGGISRLNVDYTQGAKPVIKWGKPFDRSDIDSYEYSTNLDSKDLVGGEFFIFTLRDDNTEVELMLLNPQGVLLKYVTNTNLDYYLINLTTKRTDPYYNNVLFGKNINPNLKMLPHLSRVFILSNVMVLSLATLESEEDKWAKIELQANS